MTGIELIAKERQKQIDKHGFTGEHHANHPEWYDEGQLVWAARVMTSEWFIEENIKSKIIVPKNWDQEWWISLCRKPYEERLIIAGALIAAEIDRLLALR